MSAFRNFWLLYMRNLRQMPRIPVVLVFGIVMPVIQLVLFGSIFESVTKLPTFQEQYPEVNYKSYIAPALILFTTFIGMANASAALIVDLRTGYFEKLRTTPASPLQVIGARLLAESTRVAGQAVFVLLLSMALGAKVVSGFLGAVVMIVLVVFFSACTAGLAVTALAMKTKSDQATQSAFPLFFVLLFLSSAFMVKGQMPEWVQNVVTLNPVDYLIQVVRELMVGKNVGGVMEASWPVAEIGIVLGVSLASAALLALLNLRVYKSSVEER